MMFQQKPINLHLLSKRKLNKIKIPNNLFVHLKGNRLLLYQNKRRLMSNNWINKVTIKIHQKIFSMTSKLLLQELFLSSNKILLISMNMNHMIQLNKKFYKHRQINNPPKKIIQYNINMLKMWSRKCFKLFKKKLTNVLSRKRQRKFIMFLSKRLKKFILLLTKWLRKCTPYLSLFIILTSKRLNKFTMWSSQILKKFIL